MKLNEVIGLYNNLQSLVNKEMKASLAFKFSRIIRILESEIKTFEEQKNNLIDKYGDRDEDGNIKTTEDGSVIFIKEQEQTMLQEYQDLINSELDLDLPKIKIDELDTISSITPEKIMQLDSIIEE